MIQPLRVWPAVLFLALQWILVHVVGWIIPASIPHFFSAMGGGILGLLLMILWWLLWSRADRSERWGTLGISIGLFAVTAVLVDGSARNALILFGTPIFCAAFVGGALISRRMRPTRRRGRILALVLLVCFGWMLVRTEGVDGDMDVAYAWRWSPTAEQKLLASKIDLGTGGAAMETTEAMEPAAWPNFRGARRDNVIESLSIAGDWNLQPPVELWRRPVGPGWSSFAVVGKRLYTQEQLGEQELVRCYDATSGEAIWTHTDQARFWEALAGAGPRATPTYADGAIFTLGATGILNALDAGTGALLWSRDAAEDCAATTPDWGFASSPLVIDGLVIVHTGGADGRAVVAYDQSTGEPSWFAAAGALSYSAPHPAVIAGQRQIVMLTGDGAHGIAIKDGATLWQHDWPMSGGARIVQPLILEDGTIFVGTGFGMGVRRLQVDLNEGEWRVQEGWTSTGLKPYYNDFVEYDGTLYGFDGRILAAVDTASGERLWKGGRFGNGQLLLIQDQGLLLVLSDRGEVALVKATTDRFEELSRFKAIDGKSWNHPVIADGRLFVRNGEEMAAFQLSVKE